MRSSIWSVRSSGRALTSRVTSRPARIPKSRRAARKIRMKSAVPNQPPVGEINGGVIRHNLRRYRFSHTVRVVLQSSTGTYRQRPYNTTLARELLRFASLDFFCQLGKDREGITNHTKICHGEDWRMFVFVDGDDIL